MACRRVQCVNDDCLAISLGRDNCFDYTVSGLFFHSFLNTFWQIIFHCFIVADVFGNSSSSGVCGFFISFFLFFLLDFF